MDLLRLVLKGALRAGSTSTVGATVRITVFQGQSGLAFAANMSGSYNPVVDSTSTRLLYDRYYFVPPAQTVYPVTPVHINLKAKHRQKFSGSGANTNTGESVFIIVQSDAVAGTTAPNWSAGVLEEWFKP